LNLLSECDEELRKQLKSKDAKTKKESLGKIKEVCDEGVTDNDDDDDDDEEAEEEEVGNESILGTPVSNVFGTELWNIIECARCGYR
jgi:hypothetical protein